MRANPEDRKKEVSRLEDLDDSKLTARIFRVEFNKPRLKDTSMNSSLVVFFAALSLLSLVTTKNERVLTKLEKNGIVGSQDVRGFCVGYPVCVQPSSSCPNANNQQACELGEEIESVNSDANLGCAVVLSGGAMV